MYQVNTTDVDERLARLPVAARAGVASAVALLRSDPWSSDPLVGRNPEAPVRQLSFLAGARRGLVYFLILERERRVDVLEIRFPIRRSHA